MEKGKGEETELPGGGRPHLHRVVQFSGYHATTNVWAGVKFGNKVIMNWAFLTNTLT
jgi:hypothetical protein